MLKRLPGVALLASLYLLLGVGAARAGGATVSPVDGSTVNVNLQSLAGAMAATSTSTFLSVQDGAGSTGTVGYAVLGASLPVSLQNVDEYGRLSVRQGASNIDLFNRIRVSFPYTIFESQSEYGLDSYLWTSSTTGNSVVVAVSSESSTQLSVSTMTTDRAASQTKLYYRYQPGKSQLIMLTGSFPSPKNGVVARMGYFDDFNGVYIQYSTSGLQAVIRSTSTGVLTETIVSTANWSGDSLNGRGPSDFVIDPSSSNIYFIEVQWLGVGGVRVGIVNDGDLIIGHDFSNNNNRLSTYMSTANLPVRYEIKNTTVTNSGTSMRQICATIVSEGGQVPFGVRFATTTIASTSVSTLSPVLSIRLKTNFKGKTNRGQVALNKFTIYVSGGADVIYSIIQGGSLAGAAFADIDSDSIAQADVSATSITGGHTIETGIAPGGKLQEILAYDQSKFPLTLSFDGTVSDTISIVAVSVAGGTATRAAMVWDEIR